MKNLVFIKTTSRTAKDCPSLVLQVSDELLVEFDPVFLAWVESHVAILDPPNLLTAVHSQGSVYLSNNDVQTWTKPSTSHNSSLYFRWSKMQEFSWTGQQPSRGIYELFTFMIGVFGENVRPSVDERFFWYISLASDLIVLFIVAQKGRFNRGNVFEALIWLISTNSRIRWGTLVILQVGLYRCCTSSISEFSEFKIEAGIAAVLYILSA